jgi:hypothetical protein
VYCRQTATGSQHRRRRCPHRRQVILTATPEAVPTAGAVQITARTQAGERPLTTTARATFPLATDRSGTVASSTTEQLLLVVKPAKK